MPYVPNFGPVLRAWQPLLLALRYTLLLALMAISFGCVIGLFVAILRISRYRLLSAPAALYINFFRGIPQMVYLIWLYNGIAMLTGASFPPLGAAAFCLATQYGGYLAEIFRSGIQAIGKGQNEAAHAVGLTSVQTFRHVILPQAIRIIIPPIGNMWVGAIKDSSLVSILGVMELMRTAQVQNTMSWRPFEFYTTVAVIYVLLVWLSSKGTGALEKRLRHA